jgi:DNA-directed RNA polymerase subunit RPC12/RpoP
MRVIKAADPAEETEIECRYCKSILAYTWMDTKYRDVLTAMESYITCPVCGRDIVIAQYRNYSYSPPSTPMDNNFYYTLDCNTSAEAR